MNILFVSVSDMGDANYHRAEALKRYATKPHEIRVWSWKGYTDYPNDDRTVPQELVDWADVIHQNNTPPWYWTHVHEHPCVVYEFRGGFARMDSAELWGWQTTHKAPVIATPELGRFFPRFHYLPTPVNTEGWTPCDSFPETELPIDLAQTPSRRDYKDTDALIKVCKSFKPDELRLNLIEGVEKKEALTRVRECDALFGKFKVGDIGGSEREALSFGLAVLCRLQPIVVAYHPNHPVANVGSQKELRDALRNMVKHPEVVTEIKKWSRAWCESFFGYQTVAARMEAFYEYVLRGDSKYWFKKHSEIWMAAAQKNYDIDTFINPMKLRW
jgi:hypothetical protein